MSAHTKRNLLLALILSALAPLSSPSQAAEPPPYPGECHKGERPFGSDTVTQWRPSCRGDRGLVWVMNHTSGCMALVDEPTGQPLQYFQALEGGERLRAGVLTPDGFVSCIPPRKGGYLFLDQGESVAGLLYAPASRRRFAVREVDGERVMVWRFTRPGLRSIVPVAAVQQARCIPRPPERNGFLRWPRTILPFGIERCRKVEGSKEET